MYPVTICGAGRKFLPYYGGMILGINRYDSNLCTPWGYISDTVLCILPSVYFLSVVYVMSDTDRYPKTTLNEKNKTEKSKAKSDSRAENPGVQLFGKERNVK